MSYGFSPGAPGQTDIYESSEADVLWGSMPYSSHVFVPAHIDSTAVGTGSPTSLLLPGTVMGKLDSGAGWVDYDNDATDGSQQAQGILVEECNLLDPMAAANADRQWRILIAGPVKAASLLLLDQKARTHLRSQGIVFDDEYTGGFLGYRRQVGVTGNTTVVAADSGTLFIVTGGSGVTFTLPAKAVGLRFQFYNAVNQDMVISSAGSADDIIADGDLAADTVTFSTSSHKIGSCLEVICEYVGSTLTWITFNRGGTTETVA